MEKTVVIVDDFRSVRNIVRKALEKKGLKVLEAEDGEDALKYFNGTHIDLLISDYDMPKLDGAQLIGKVRVMEGYRRLPIIMLTTNKKERNEDETRDLRINDWVVKPFDILDFYKSVETQLKMEF
jgi:two-component system chemotaxis response regulator CheY